MYQVGRQKCETVEVKGQEPIDFTGLQVLPHDLNDTPLKFFRDFLSQWSHVEFSVQLLGSTFWEEKITYSGCRQMLS